MRLEDMTGLAPRFCAPSYDPKLPEPPATIAPGADRLLGLRPARPSHRDHVPAGRPEGHGTGMVRALRHSRACQTDHAYV